VYTDAFDKRALPETETCHMGVKPPWRTLIEPVVPNPGFWAIDPALSASVTDSEALGMITVFPSEPLVDPGRGGVTSSIALSGLRSPFGAILRGADGAENSPAQDAFNLQNERGLASFHLKHRSVSSMVYSLPFGTDKKWLQEGIASKVFGAWQVSGIYSMQSGFPSTVNIQGDTAGVGAGTGGIFIRPNAVAGQDWQLPSDQRTTSRYFNTAAFSAPATGQFGNVGRNTIIGPGLVNLDVVLAKSIDFTETRKLQFRAEAFNVLNHSNYTIVGRLLNTPTFGRVQGQLDPRQIQFDAKLLF
jgi:hypothetical protein